MSKNQTLQTILELFKIDACSSEYAAACVLADIVDENHALEDFIYDDEGDDNREELREFIDNFDIVGDQCLEFDGAEYRIIRDSDIWDIYVSEIENIVTDCYDLKLDEIPSFIALEIDWEQTAKNAYVDGYGHTFSTYDQSEIEVKIDGKLEFYVFRTN